MFERVMLVVLVVVLVVNILETRSSRKWAMEAWSVCRTVQFNQDMDRPAK